ncbi:uncharacterized protein DNG_02600 [Cephalotrichum gorgonifer]|uniref:Kinetochore protein Sos7 coiled-coil domain-containing protein n=1 Tax=Cephalotrichum gorgonifer TaxID=2041049 RepID=A0AAE8MTB9_9PEZI|nr:uncharacterized protein DNG_02600 [Cephalotrichum gorgonifer]
MDKKRIQKQGTRSTKPHRFHWRRPSKGPNESDDTRQPPNRPQAIAAAKMASSTDEILAALSSLQSQPLSILKLSEPITTVSTEPRPRSSDASSSSLTEAPTPSSLEADLSHYRELFSKLRFSYVEQVTKEKFIRAIVGEPPLIVSPQENVALEKENVGAKRRLKALKVEMADLVAELERRGRDLSRRHEGIETQTIQLRELPEKIAELEEGIAELRKLHETGEGPEMSLPLGRTRELVDERKAEQAKLDRELEQLRAKLPRKKKELERLGAEVQSLEAKRQTSGAAAREARRRKENALGGVEDDLEERGRWWRASEVVLTQALDT